MTTLIRFSKSALMCVSSACLAGSLSMAAGTALRAQDTTAHPPAARVVTLDDAIRLALDQNGTVRLARSASGLDSLSVRQFRNQFLPTLSVASQSSQGYLNGPPTRIGSGVQNALATSIGLSSSITLYDGLQNVNALHEAEIVSRAGGRDLDRTEQTVVFTVMSEFFALTTQRDLLRVQQENLVAQRQQLAQIEAFTTAGTHPISDLYQQQAATAAAQLGVATATQAVQLAEVDLIEELVLDPRDSYSFVAPAAESAVGPAFNLDSLTRLALTQRADVQAQSLRVEAAQRELLVAGGARLPTVAATFSYGTALTTGATAAFAQQLNQARGGSVGIGISLPLLDRSAVPIARQRAQVALETATLTLRDERQGVALDVRRAYLSVESAHAQITAADAQVNAATLGLKASVARYLAGATGATFVEVTLARATLVQAQSALVTARSNLTLQQALTSYYTGALNAMGRQ